MNKDIFAEFESLDSKEWVESIKKYLKGKPYESLEQVVEEDIVLAPFARKEDLNASEQLPILGNNAWLIAESFEIDANNIKKSHLQIQLALQGGVNSIRLHFKNGTPSLLTVLLEGVYLDMIHLHLEGAAVVENPLAWIKAVSELERAELSIGTLSTVDIDAAFIKEAMSMLPKWSFLNIQIENHQAEVSPATAIAEAMLGASKQITALTDFGLSLDEAQRQIHFNLMIDDDYFLSIARLRTIKRLWLALLEAFGAETVFWPKIHVKTSYGEKETPYWDMIAATTQALSAAVAQVYSIEICPVSGMEVSNEFARRIARNVQHLLKMESHIDSIIDPAAGSYYIEQYSKALSQKAWFLFTNKSNNH